MDSINVGGLVADLDINTTLLDRNLKNADNALYTVQRAIFEAQRAFNTSQITLSEYTSRILYLTEAQNELVAAMNQATSATVRNTSATRSNSGAAQALGAATAKASNRAAMFGVAMMQVGSIIDDVQYGFKGVVNNIGPFTYSMAAAAGASTGAGLAIGAAAQIIVVAGYQAYLNWDRLMDVMGMPTVRTEAEQMDALAKATERTAEQTERLNKYKRENAKITEMMASRTKEQEKVADNVSDAVTEAGAGKVVGSLANSMKEDGLGAKMNRDDKAELNSLRKPTWLLSPDDPRRKEAQAKYEKKLDEINKRLDEETIKKAERLLVQAQDDPAVLKSIIAKVKRHPQAFPPGFLQQLQQNTPEGRADTLERDLNSEANENKAEFEKKRVDEEDDYEEDRLQESIRRNKEAKRKREALQKKQVAEGRKHVAGADSFAERAVASANLGGGQADIDAARKKIGDALKAKGFTDEGSSKITDAIMEDAQKKVKDRVMDRALNGDLADEEKPEQRKTKSEQFSAEDLAAKVQSGVGGGDEQQKKQVKLQDMMEKHLAKLVAMGGGNPWAQVQIK